MVESTILDGLVQSGVAIAAHRPWPRAQVESAVWRRAAEHLRDGDLTLLGLWGDTDAVHLALADDANAVTVLSLVCRDGRFPAISHLHPPAARLERAIADLYGYTPEGALDARPWLDHGRWELRHPLGERAPARAPPAYRFLPAEGESLHQIPVGPVHAGIIEPGHFRLTCYGETVVRLEQRLGYTHKGIDALMQGATLDHAAKLAGRVSGDSTVAYAYAFARAAEAALGLDVPPRAIMLRAVMAELERLANHFGDIGGVCNDAAFALMNAHCNVLRERVLRAADAAFGHRLMRDCILPGGIAIDLAPSGAWALAALIAEAELRFPSLVKLYDSTASLQNRTVGAGRLSADLARQYGAGGFVGRASGRGFDARRALPYPPYDQLAFAVSVRDQGDVDARVWIRIEEVRQSLALLRQLLDRLPDGPVRVEPSLRAGEGIALVEGFRGDVLAWLRLGLDGTVERCHLRDPSWFQWPLLEAVIEGNIVADFPLCNKSFNCSYSGHDL